MFKRRNRGGRRRSYGSRAAGYAGKAKASARRAWTAVRGLKMYKWIALGAGVLVVALVFFTGSKLSQTIFGLNPKNKTNG